MILVEGGTRILPSSLKSLRKKRVQVSLTLASKCEPSSIVTRIEPDAVYIGDERIPDAHGLLGRRKRGISSGQDARCAGGSSRARAGES